MSMDMWTPKIPVGSILSRPKGLVMHRGIYLGNGWVYENSWLLGERLSTFSDFAARRRVKVERVLKIPASEIYRRVKRSIGRPYNVITNNCDHAVTRIEDGSPRSMQLLGVTLATIFAAMILRSLSRRLPHLAH